MLSSGPGRVPEALAAPPLGLQTDVLTPVAGTLLLPAAAAALPINDSTPPLLLAPLLLP
jgi:hypothetical protein